MTQPDRVTTVLAPLRAWTWARRAGACTALAALIALAAFIPVLFTGATAAAEDPVERTLVGNVMQRGDIAGCCALNGADIGQRFTTGGNADGYRLTKIELQLEISNSDDTENLEYTVGLWSSVSEDDDSPGLPGELLASYVRSGPITDGLNTFVDEYVAEGGGGYWVYPDTEYFVVFDVETGTGSDSWYWVSTSWGLEDTGTLPGWSIADTKVGRLSDSDSWTSTQYNYKMKLSGYEVHLPSPEDRPTDSTFVDTSDEPEFRRLPSGAEGGEDNLCEDGYHYAYEARYVYRTSRNRLYYSVEDEPPGSLTSIDQPDGEPEPTFTRVGLEWFDYCLSDELVDIPSGTPGEPGPTTRGHRAYQPRSIEDLCVTRGLSASACAELSVTDRFRTHSIEDLCVTGALSVSACAEMNATRRAALLQHPEIRAVVQGGTLPDWSPPGGWPVWLIERGILTETEAANTPSARQAAAEGPRLDCLGLQGLDENGAVLVDHNGDAHTGYGTGYDCSTRAGREAVFNEWAEHQGLDLEPSDWWGD